MEYILILKESPAELAFRAEVRAFIRENLPAELKAKVQAFARLEKADITLWHRIMFHKGWGAPGWPIEYGGTGWSFTFRKIFEDEANLGGAPRLMPFVNMIGPVLQSFGTPWQKERFLPPILSLDEWWCQGYSEPEAGSDLASLRTQARLKGDRFIVNGRKIWTSFAAAADWMFCLVRTNTEVKPQAGITFLLIDMKSPGIAVRPITTLNGDNDVAEVTLDDVEVPLRNVVYEIDKGWTVAKHLLGHERTEVALVGHNKRMIARIKALLDVDGALLSSSFQDRLMQLELRLIAQEWLLMQVLSLPVGASDSRVSILKLQGSQIAQQLGELLLECAGPNAIRASDRTAPPLDLLAADAWWFGLPEAYLDARKHTIYGGTNEIQKTIISKAVLGAQ